jgi:DNA repair exonuclease SbcCD ATPase subunit
LFWEVALLIFKKITWRNFLSTGNVANTVDLNKHSSTLITGRNGDGKSTILCALTFALFGKPFRNISKNQLVNSINKKNCVVEIEFSTNGHEYTVIRGIKPNVFEIYCDGQLINQDAALKDYKKVLEQQILKLNYKTFTQVVILGSATYVPFMQLKSTERREVIEDILDIKVFSLMNAILKDKAAAVKEQIGKIEADIANHKTRIQAQRKLIDVLESNRQNVLAGIQRQIDNNNAAIAEAQSVIETTREAIARLQANAASDQISEAVAAATKLKVKLSTNIDTCQHDADFFNENTTCPTCSQHIPDQHKHKVLAEIDQKIAEHKRKLEQINKAIDKLNAQLAAANQYADQIRTYSIDISTQTNKIALLTEQNVNLAAEIAAVAADVGNLTEEKRKMRDYADTAIELVNTKRDLLEVRRLHDVAAALLKDTGVKTAIIREYLPVINKLINKYLAAMDFFVKFELDESFQEVIKSRGRDAFTYDSFSEGEKRRLDLAILFTWRQIAKMKNSVNTNLMILDEILDGALDGAGIDYFLSIMNHFGEHTNVFVISHRDIVDKFDHTIRFEKTNDFSTIAVS